MTRIENYKRELKRSFENKIGSDSLNLTYQELINLLISYQDKKELTDFYEDLKKEKKVTQ